MSSPERAGPSLKSTQHIGSRARTQTQACGQDWSGGSLLEQRDSVLGTRGPALSLGPRDLGSSYSLDALRHAGIIPLPLCSPSSPTFPFVRRAEERPSLQWLHSQANVRSAASHSDFSRLLQDLPKGPAFPPKCPAGARGQFLRKPRPLSARW